MGDFADNIEAFRAQMMARVPEQMARLDWPREKVDAFRQQRLRDVLTHVIEHSPWHRERLAHVDPETFRIEDVAELPVMSKADLIEHFDGIATDPRLTRARCEAYLERNETELLDGEFAVMASGGTTGVRHISAAHIDDMGTTFTAGLFRFVMRYRIRSGQATGARPEPPFTVASAPGHHSGNVLKRLMGSEDGRSASVVEPMGDIVAALNAADPDHVIVYSSFIPHLAAEAKAGRLRIRPHIITPVAESVLPEHEAAVQEAWGGCAVMSSWGTTEAGLLGAGSGFEPGMLLLDDLMIIEPVDAAGEPVPPGVLADKLFVTPLTPRAVPLVRYELTDQLTVLEGPARCGSSFTRVSYVRGRQDEGFVYDGGILVHAHTFRTVMTRQKAIAEYQVEQTPDGALLRAVLAPDVSGIDPEGLAGQLAERLEHVGVASPQVDVTVVSGIPRTGAGKLRRFLPLRGPATVSSASADTVASAGSGDISATGAPARG